MKKLLLFLLVVVFSFGQEEDLMSILDEEVKSEPAPVIATFKTSRLINGHTIEMPAKNELIFIISHRFGPANSGAYEFFGLDKATIRLGLEYTLPIDFICIGVGRSVYKKTYDGFIKIKALKQRKGKMPITLTLLSTTSLFSVKWQDPARQNFFSSRLAFSHQILIARKFNKRLSLQLMPTIVHKNLVPLKSHSNDIFMIGAGGRFKITNRIALTAEYYHFITQKDKLPTVNGSTPVPPLGIGVDIETGGHVFQLFATNAQAMFNTGFLTETTAKWEKGGIFFGFNITRTFDLGGK